MSHTGLFFYGFSLIALIFSFFVILGRNPISNAFSLVAVFFCLAADYVLLQAHFIAAIQILVYAGAVMVLFVFVIMLLNADTKNLDIVKGRGKVWGFRSGAAVLCVALATIFIWSITNSPMSDITTGQLSPEKIDQLGGNVQVISQLMFSDYILPFEITSILLLVGIVGSVALAKRRLK